MRTFLNVIGFIWLLPVNLIVWAVLLILLWRGQFEEVTLQPNLALRWDVDNNSKFYKILSKDGWFGFVAVSNIIVVDDDPYELFEKHIRHEDAHVSQNYVLGILFYPLYFLCSIFIFCFLWNKHSYLDNPFERHARRLAGQRVDIPREEWPKGPHDRWSFW